MASATGATASLIPGNSGRNALRLSEGIERQHKERFRKVTGRTYVSLQADYFSLENQYDRLEDFVTQSFLQ